MFTIPTPLKPKLAKSSPYLVALYAAFATFATYGSMYAFRKGLSAANFKGLAYSGIDLKIIFVIAQTVGYTLSKFMGIRIISAMKHHTRAASIIILITLAELALVFFALTPTPYNIFFIFLNGIPLGMVWGLVFSYVEGRRTTEFIGSALAVSFIFSSGIVKSIGQWLVHTFGITENWMLPATGALFYLPMLLFVFLLEQIPPPDKEDKELRTERLPMTAKERREFVTHFLPGLVVLVLTYVLLSIIRDFRDNFSSNVWQELGVAEPSIFAKTETIIAVVVLVIMSVLMVIRNNFRALQLNHLMVLAGFLLAGASTYAYAQGMMSPFYWMILSGLGLYLGYIPFNVMFFERLIAATRKPANVGFLIYIADAFGYLGTIAVMLYKNFGTGHMSYHRFLIDALYGVSITGVVFIAVSFFYFERKITGDHRNN